MNLQNATHILFLTDITGLHYSTLRSTFAEGKDSYGPPVFGSRLIVQNTGELENVAHEVLGWKTAA